MPQVSTVGTGGDYTTLSAWEAGESASDYGAGNPAIAEITGSVALDNITGTWLRGYEIKAASGEEWQTGSGTAVITGNGTWIHTPSTVNIDYKITDLDITGTTIDIRTTDTTAVWSVDRCRVRRFQATISANTNVTATGCLIVLDGTDRATDGSASGICELVNCTIICGGSSFGAVRWKCTNVFSFGAGSNDFILTLAGSDYNASEDSTAPGGNSLTSRTSADFADFGGADYRTADGSALATAGQGGTHIGYLLEPSSGDALTADDLQSLSQLSRPLVDRPDTAGPPVIIGTTISGDVVALSTDIDALTVVIDTEVSQ